MVIVHDFPRSGESPQSDEQTDKALWMRLADRLYGIPPGETLRLVSGPATATIRAIDDCFIAIHLHNMEVTPSEGETIDLRSSKTALLLASRGFDFAPGEEERTAWFAAPPNGIDDTPSTIPITRQRRRAAERRARKRGGWR